jgi:hypothetical protein
VFQFRASFSDLIEMLPYRVYVGTGSEDPTATLTTADLPKSHYARYRCIYISSDGAQCSTWTRVPYVIDTYLRGLASILGVAANSTVSKDQLEAQISASLHRMMCQHHDETTRAEQIQALSVSSRLVIEQWRINEHRWRSAGKLAWQHRATDQPSSVDDVLLPATARDSDQQIQEVIRLHDENEKLRGELMSLREASWLSAVGGA